MQDRVPFARRTGWKLEPNALAVLRGNFQREKTACIDLTESNPTRCGFPYPQEKILAGLADPKNMVYDPHPQGALKAREAVIRYYQRKGFEVHPRQIFLTASTSEAYSMIFRLLLNPNERVLAGQPSYPLFEFLMGLNDARRDAYPLIYKEGAWAIDLRALKKTIHSKTRAILVVHPNNPTGSFLTQKEFIALKKICQTHHLALICDEVFSDYPLGENPRKVLSLVETKDILCFCLGGLSKSLGLPQMKLSWIVLNGPPEKLRSAIGRLEVIADTYLSVNTPAQNALPDWLLGQDSIQQEILGRLRQNQEFLKKAVSGSPCEYLPSQGGWYAILKLPDCRTEEAWVLDFLENDHVFVHPGYFFDFREEPYVVLSLLPEPSVLEEGITRILKRIKARLKGVDTR